MLVFHVDSAPFSSLFLLAMKLRPREVNDSPQATAGCWRGRDPAQALGSACTNNKQGPAAPRAGGVLRCEPRGGGQAGTWWLLTWPGGVQPRAGGPPAGQPVLPAHGWPPPAALHRLLIPSFLANWHLIPHHLGAKRVSATSWCFFESTCKFSK